MQKYINYLKLKIKRLMSNYPLTTNHFTVEWGATNIGFSEISGLSIGVETIKIREGSSSQNSSIKMPGKKIYSNIILKRVLRKNDLEFYDWLNTINLNTVERRDLIISLLNENHEPVIVWRLKNAFPVNISWANLNADTSEAAMESIEITHEGITVQSI